MKQPLKDRKDKLNILRELRKKSVQVTQKEPPDDLFIQCKNCNGNFTTKQIKNNYYICLDCGHYFRISVRRRYKMIMDHGSFKELDRKMETGNPLDFPEYREKIETAIETSGLKEAVVTGVGKIDGIETVVAIMDNRFLMGSMGTIVGEKLTRAIEYATKYKLPLIIFTTSGGARMQEGIFSLMQMAKTSAALFKYHEIGGFYISYITHPTMGGVTASFASLGDIILAEPNALMGFAGPRVIEQTIKQKLPEGFQRSEFQLEHGFIDQIVPRNEMKETLSFLLKFHGKVGNK